MSKEVLDEIDEFKKPSKPFPIVGIGASAGGLQAIVEILQNLPAETGMAFIYIQHLDSEHESKLDEILQRETKMKVEQVANLVPIESNHFYIIPPNKDLEMVDGALKLSARAPKPTIHMPINKFFMSLAAKQKQSSIGIVLSGTATDGTLGLKAIKSAGGLTYAQDASAQFNSMPKAAVAEGVVDEVLSPKEIAKELEGISKRSYLLTSALKEDSDDSNEEKAVQDEHAAFIKEEDLKNILTILKARVGVDFSNYKKNTINRRIIRRMLLHKLEALSEYGELLKNNKQEVVLLYQDLLINVTHFFRDTDACLCLKNEVLPTLLREKSNKSPLRIWVPACSTGEEAYSLAILILELLGDAAANISVQIFATDLSESAIQKARVGLYSIADLEDVSAERLLKYFTKVDGHYRILKRIREMTIFAPHNVLKDPPFSRLDLISCCNLLIYFESVLQKQVFMNFHYALNKNGYLVLGRSETVGPSARLFHSIDKKARVYIKKSETPSRLQFDLNYNLLPTEETEVKEVKKKPVIKEPSPVQGLERVVDTLLLEKYTPPAVVVNHELDIVQFRGSANLFLEFPSGKASLNLLKMARTGLALELRNAANKVIKTGEPEKKGGIEIKVNDKIYVVGFEVTSLDSLSNQNLLLIVFNEEQNLPITEGKVSHSKDRRVKQLESDLIELRADMRAVVEEQDAANEELQSANEEIVSSNEELQSINEELETSKEELESSNEELLTINQELQVRNEQLTESQEYTEAVIATIREAVLILDVTLHVKAANKAFYKMFAVNEEETEGRLIYEVGYNGEWNLPRLKGVLENMLVRNNHVNGYELKHEFKSVGEKVLLINARKITQRYHGQPVVLLAIEDITEHKQAERLLEEREAWLRNMTNSVPVMIWVAGRDKNFTFLNKTWLAFTGRKISQETGIGWTEGIHLQDLPLCLSTYHASFEERKPFSIEYRMKRHDGEYRWVLNTAVPTYDSTEEFSGYIGTCIEIHDKRLMSDELEQRVGERTQQLQEANSNLERSNSELQQFAYVASHDLQEPLRKIITFSNRIKEKDADALSSTGKEYLEKIHSSSERMRHLIDDLLNFSRISRFDKKFVRTDLTKVFKEVLLDFDLLIQEKRAQLNIEGKLPVLDVIPLQMNQLFHNLMSNALKFTALNATPVITVDCRVLPAEELRNYPRLDENESYYEITFKDNGIGFPQEFADQIFIIFQRLNEKDQYAGTGIGLALCRKIVRNHRGEITARSEEGKGSTFFIILPKKQPWADDVEV